MSARPRIAVATFAALTLVASAAALAHACGQCLEDKIAATFDAGVRERAARIGHVVVFTEVKGPAAGAPPSLQEFIVRTLAATRGVDAGSVRVSLDPPAAAFACDSRVRASILAAASPRLAARRLSLAVLRVDDGHRVGTAPPRATAGGALRSRGGGAAARSILPRGADAATAAATTRPRSARATMAR